MPPRRSFPSAVLRPFEPHDGHRGIPNTSRRSRGLERALRRYCVQVATNWSELDVVLYRLNFFSRCVGVEFHAPPPVDLRFCTCCDNRKSTLFNIKLSGKEVSISLSRGTPKRNPSTKARAIFSTSSAPISRVLVTNLYIYALSSPCSSSPGNAPADTPAFSLNSSLDSAAEFSRLCAITSIAASRAPTIRG